MKTFSCIWLLARSAYKTSFKIYWELLYVQKDHVQVNACVEGNAAHLDDTSQLLEF